MSMTQVVLSFFIPLFTGHLHFPISAGFLNLFIVVNLNELFVLNRLPELFKNNICWKYLLSVSGLCFLSVVMSFEGFHFKVPQSNRRNFALHFVLLVSLRNSPLSQSDEVLSSFCFIFHCKL